MVSRSALISKLRTDLQVQLGSATSPKQPYTNLDPNKGLVSRMWTDTVNAMGSSVGLGPRVGTGLSCATTLAA
eukprot:COSAG01_NODE_5029_length_4536_cov_22.812261_1_plen_73_part_00